VDRRDPAPASVDAELPALSRNVALNAEALGELALLDQVSGPQKRSALPSTNASKLVRSRSHSSNSKEAKTFSRCCSRLIGRMIVVVGNENDLDYPLSMRFRIGRDKAREPPHI
jgi:hypothetical protein